MDIRLWLAYLESHFPGGGATYRTRSLLPAFLLPPSIADRGTVEKPGLMLALDTGGTGVGVAFRLPREAVADEMALLWRREMAVGSYSAKWLRAKTREGDVRVLGFVANKRAANYVCGLSEGESAELVANASGFLGSNLEYLVRTAAGLAEHGIKDALVERLVRLCAERAPKPAGEPLINIET